MTATAGRFQHNKPWTRGAETCDQGGESGGGTMLQVIERISLAFAMALALLAVVMSGGQTGRYWASKYIAQAFAPAAVDLGTVGGR